MNTVDTTSYFQPLRKTITVALSSAEAFDLFTAGIGGWWPLGNYSVGRERAVRCEVECRSGGRVYEVRDDGETFIWGAVLEWQPPHRVVMSWHPGRTVETAQEVEVRFSPAGSGTIVELEHRGWATLGEAAEDTRKEYDAGWETVLGGHFARACRSASGKVS